MDTNPFKFTKTIPFFLSFYNENIERKKSNAKNCHLDFMSSSNDELVKFLQESLELKFAIDFTLVKISKFRKPDETTVFIVSEKNFFTIILMQILQEL